MSGLRAFLLGLLALSCSAADLDLPIATGEWPPFVSQKLPGHGPVAQLVSAVCAEMQIKPRFIFTSWPLAERMVERGQVFAAFPYTMTPDRHQRFDFSASLFDTRSVLFYDRQHYVSPPVINTLDELRSYQVGAIYGEWYVDELQRAKVPLDMGNAYEQSLAKLLAGRVDLVPMSDRLGRYYIANHFAAQASRFGAISHLQAPNPITNHLLVSRQYSGAKAKLAAFNAAMARLQQRGELEALLKAAGL